MRLRDCCLAYISNEKIEKGLQCFICQRHCCTVSLQSRCCVSVVITSKRRPRMRRVMCAMFGMFGLWGTLNIPFAYVSVCVCVLQAQWWVRQLGVTSATCWLESRTPGSLSGTIRRLPMSTENSFLWHAGRNNCEKRNVCVHAMAALNKPLSPFVIGARSTW